MPTDSGDAAEQEAIEAGPACDPMTIGSAGQPAASSTTACRGRRPGVAALPGPEARGLQLRGDAGDQFL